MRRKFKEGNKNVSCVFPVFDWCRCIKCNQEFRFVSGWIFSSGFIDKYLCKKCAPNKSTAVKLFIKDHFAGIPSGKAPTPPSVPNREDSNIGLGCIHKPTGQLCPYNPDTPEGVKKAYIMKGSKDGL
jgi:hypothetical protein